MKRTITVVMQELIDTKKERDSYGPHHPHRHDLSWKVEQLMSELAALYSI